jgi:hypothetical protein
MRDIGWGSIAVRLVSVLDLVAFGDPVQGECPDGRARWGAIKRPGADRQGPRPNGRFTKRDPHMTGLTRPASANLSATSTISPLGHLAYRDDLEIARRRKKHLAPWHVEPMPMPQEAASAPAAGPDGKPANRKRSFSRSRQPTAFQLGLALHMFVAERRSALD